MGTPILEFLASLLIEGEHDGGYVVDRAPEITDEGELLVTVNGADYAIKAEAF
ncbi:hypothetical protein [Microbacterium sp. T32]|uniref:hypothetical protein n=1 Tax=Microbacterium sp. T32 TaxID=1776083 RepID=UPI000A88D41E|nr:hypothetical protein [Microbacterium sp. T32]